MKQSSATLDAFAGQGFGLRQIQPASTPGASRRSLTNQQNDIVHARGNLKINAVAGSGKTTTLVEYARHQQQAGLRSGSGSGRSNPGGLYLAFNKTVRQAAVGAFQSAGVGGVDVHTAHSLAYRHVIGKTDIQLLPAGQYPAYELAAMLKTQTSVTSCLPPTRRAAPWLAIAAHSLQLLAWFCNHDAKTIGQLNYEDLLRYDTTAARQFAAYFLPVINAGATWLWQQMEQGKLKVTHDFYLKKFRLSQPHLDYDYILFDEGQDASPTMLDVFSQQTHATRVIVGDTHQQIYGFRHAVNSLDQVDYAAYELNRSFRFGPPVAELAMQVLALKEMVNPFLGENKPYKPQPIEGAGKHQPLGKESNGVVIGRTNLELLGAAINALCVEESIGTLYFEGGLHSYTFMDNGVGLLDMLHLYNGEHHRIRHPLLKNMDSLDELEAYIDQTGDGQMKTALTLVLLYKNDLPGYLQQIQEAHLPAHQRAWTDVTFSTVHRCKGLEYDHVQLCDDFIDQEKLATSLDHLKTQQQCEELNLPVPVPVKPSDVIEEINMLYVAITRTKGQVDLPDSQYYLRWPSPQAAGVA